MKANSSVLDRFLRYVVIPTMSDENSQTVPSSPKQWVLAKLLARELEDLGFAVTLADNGYVYGSLAANRSEPRPAIGMIAHMDTSDAVTDENICPSVVAYNGGDIVLNREKNIVMTQKGNPSLKKYVSHHLVVTDGTTILGGDDKAGIAEIMAAAERIVRENLPHGELRIAFTPDEEIGRGADGFDVASFRADYAYTVDGLALGELEYENFNAAAATVTVHGLSVHPGSAKDQMVNAARIACEFQGLLPPDAIPERTEGYEGFIHLTDISGETELATLRYIVRDHDDQAFAQKKELLVNAVAEINRRYGEGTTELALQDSYYNMRSVLENHMEIVERAKAAMERNGITPIVQPIRGGTDGSRLSFMGLPCPNLCTGGENAHSRFEYVSVEAMEKVTDLLVTLWTE